MKRESLAYWYGEQYTDSWRLKHKTEEAEPERKLGFCASKRASFSPLKHTSTIGLSGSLELYDYSNIHQPVAFNRQNIELF